MPASIRAFFDEATNSISYLVADPVSRSAAVIDPVLAFDPAIKRVDSVPADAVIDAAGAEGLTIEWVLETHVHADHLSAADHVRKRTGAKVGIGRGILEVQRVFGPRFGIGDLKPDGGDFDCLFDDGDAIPLGSLRIEVMATPGHTPACVSYRIGDALFVGDTLFMPTMGPLERTSPEATRGSFTGRSIGFFRCPARRACSFATITRRPAATASPGRPRLTRSATATSISAAASARTIMSRCARRGTRRSSRRASSTTPCR